LLALVINILRNVLPLRRANRQLRKNRIHRLIYKIRHLLFQAILHSLRRHAPIAARNKRAIRANRQVVTHRELRMVSASSANTIFHHGRRAARLNVHRAVRTGWAKSARRVPTIRAAIEDAHREARAKTRGEPLRARRRERHSSPIALPRIRTLNYGSNRPHEARTVERRPRPSRAGPLVRLAMLRLRKLVRSYELMLPQWLNLATVLIGWQNARRCAVKVTSAIVRASRKWS